MAGTVQIMEIVLGTADGRNGLLRTNMLEAAKTMKVTTMTVNWRVCGGDGWERWGVVRSTIT